MFGKRSIDVCAWEEVEEVEEPEGVGNESGNAFMTKTKIDETLANGFRRFRSEEGAKTTMRACLGRSAAAPTPRAWEGIRDARSTRTRFASESPRALPCSRGARARFAFPEASPAPARDARETPFTGRKNKPSERTGRAFGGARAYLEPLGQT